MEQWRKGEGKEPIIIDSYFEQLKAHIDASPPNDGDGNSIG